MKAVRIHEYGGPEVLGYEDAPRPRLLDGDVLIRVHAAAVNPVDWKVRQGLLKERVQHKFPLILGWDVSGVIEEITPGVSQFKAGDQVYSRPDRALARIAALVDAGKLRAVVETVLPLAETRRGHEISQGRHARG